MDLLIPITGYANTYEELCTRTAEEGEFYNVLTGKPFMTYCKTGETEIGATGEETDVLGWFPNTAELESNVKPTDGDVYIIGLSEPYTRKKAVFEKGTVRWEDDGEENKKIVKNYKTNSMLGKAHLEPEEGIYYSVGKELPFKVYGVISSWEPVGAFISHFAKDIRGLNNRSISLGEIGYIEGAYYLYTENGWEQIDIYEPMENVYKHTYIKDGKKYRLRESPNFGNLEFFEPRR